MAGPQVAGLEPHCAPHPRAHWDLCLPIFYLWRAKPTGVSRRWRCVHCVARVSPSGRSPRATSEKNQELATTGPYAYVRNPLYLGSIVIAIGFAIAARDVWVAIAIVVFFALIYVPVIRARGSFLCTNDFRNTKSYAQPGAALVPHTLLFRQIMDWFLARAISGSIASTMLVLGAAAMLAALVAKILWFPQVMANLITRS